MFTIYNSLQGEECIMGMKRVFQKLKASVQCVKARDQYNFQKSESCPCTEADFEWWVCGSAATLFTSLNPKHNILSAPPRHNPLQTSAQHQGCLSSAALYIFSVIFNWANSSFRGIMKGSRNVNPLKQVVYRKQKNNSWLKTIVNVEANYFLFQVIMSATSGDSLITTGKKKSRLRQIALRN